MSRDRSGDGDPRRSWVRWWPHLAYGVLSLYFCAPIFAAPEGLGLSDWDQHLFYYGSVLKSVVEYGQWPFWNPWYCGGNVLWQNPQAPLLSPVFPLSALVSLPLAMKINIALHYWIGFSGVHALLTSAIGASFLPGVAFLAVVATCGGALAMHLAVGHSVFLPCFYLPFQLYFCVRATRTGAIRDVVPAAALLALMIYNGALHVVPMSVAAIGVFALVASITRRQWRPIAVALALVVGGFAFAAPKLVPVALWVTSDRFVDARTVLERPDRMTSDMLLHAYTDSFQHRGLRFDLQRSGWHEYGNYIGALGALVIVASMLWALVARGTPDRWLGVSLAVTAAVMLALSAGEFSAWAPASIANHLPLFSSFRIPSRYTIGFVLFGVATAGWAMAAILGDGAPSARARAFLAIVCVLGSADLVLRNRGQLDRAFSLPSLDRGLRPLAGVGALATDATSDPYAPNSPMFRSLMNDRAFFNCYESLQTRRVATPDGPLVETDGTSKVVDVTFSPNRVQFSIVGGREESHVFLNQNFVQGWSSDLGPVVSSSERGLPMAMLAPGQAGKFAFTFVPAGLGWGCVVFALAVATTVATWNRSLPGGPTPAGTGTRAR